MSDLSIVKCTLRCTNSQIRVSDSDQKFSGNSGLICLASENDEPESGYVRKNWKINKTMVDSDDEEDKVGWSSRIFGSMDLLGDDNLTHVYNVSQSVLLQDDINQVPLLRPSQRKEPHSLVTPFLETDYPDQENFSMEKISNIIEQKGTNDHVEKISDTNKATRKTKLTKEERTRLMEEKKLKKELEKLQKAALKARAAELKKWDKEKQKWEKGKFALKSIVAEIDTKVVEQRSHWGTFA